MTEEVKPQETIPVFETPVLLPKNNNLLKTILLIILGLVVLAGAVYAGTKINKKQTPVVIVPPVTEPTPTPDPTANWETYINDKYGISFKYPKESKIMGDINSHLFTIISGNQAVSFLASDNPENFDASEFFLRLIVPSDPDSVRSYVSFSDAKINGINFILFNQDAGYFSQQSSSLNGYLIKSGNYIISFNFGKESAPLLNQILSTFKFLDSDSTAQPVEPDGKQIGFIKKAYYQSDQQYIDIDYVEWLNDTAGEKACVEDKQCSSDCVQTSCLPNGYYIRNNNSKIRTFVFSKNAPIEILNTADLTRNKSISFDVFQKYVSENIAKYGTGSNLFWITISSGKVVNVTEQYRP